MEPDNSNGASGTDQTGAGATDTGAGTGGDGSQAGTVGGDTTAIVAEREKLEAEVRSLQSARDKLNAEITSKRGETQTTDAGTSAQTQTDPEIAALKQSVTGLEKMLRRQAVAPVAAELRGNDEFSVVAALRPDLFDSLDSYETPEAFRAAVEAENQRLTPLAQAMKESIRAEVLAEVSEKYGIRVNAPANSGGDAPAGDPDVTSLAGMSLKDIDPEQALRVLRSTT